jgi:hypothetical protein
MLPLQASFLGAFRSLYCIIHNADARLLDRNI